MSKVLILKVLVLVPGAHAEWIQIAAIAILHCLAILIGNKGQYRYQAPNL